MNRQITIIAVIASTLLIGGNPAAVAATFWDWNDAEEGLMGWMENCPGCTFVRDSNGYVSFSAIYDSEVAMYRMGNDFDMDEPPAALTLDVRSDSGSQANHIQLFLRGDGKEVYYVDSNPAGVDIGDGWRRYTVAKSGETGWPHGGSLRVELFFFGGMLQTVDVDNFGDVRKDALGTAFTYQGRLVEEGRAADGEYDFRFRLFDGAKGDQVGGMLERENVTVEDGYFTQSLDFGMAFAGRRRWLEIAVRPGDSAGAYTELSPRQEIRPSPYAIYAASGPYTGTDPVAITKHYKIELKPAEDPGSMIVWDGQKWGHKRYFETPSNNMQPYVGVGYIIAYKYGSPNVRFLGEITMFAGNSPPEGWAFCDGQLLPINQNLMLFSYLGTTYGGDGRTNFALPDLRGRVPLHKGQGFGLTKRTLGEKGGSEEIPRQ
ncbi:MAG: tail fiber protein [Phycisphaerales bacterium]|nr:MAG: tail fiber protein [Phycisphaerales bacterium]